MPPRVNVDVHERREVQATWRRSCSLNSATQLPQCALTGGRRDTVALRHAITCFLELVKSVYCLSEQTPS